MKTDTKLPIHLRKGFQDEHQKQIEEKDKEIERQRALLNVASPFTIEGKFKTQLAAAEARATKLETEFMEVAITLLFYTERHVEENPNDDPDCLDEARSAIRKFKALAAWLKAKE